VTVSPQDSSKPGVSIEKPKTNIYTMLLIISLIAISLACLLLFLEMQSYGPFLSSWKTR
jgi:uncharacterized membrane protein affecting hemolysin expression